MTLIEWHYNVTGERDEDKFCIENAPPREWEIQHFKLKEEGNKLNVTSDSYGDPDEAQVELDIVLESWARETFLDGFRVPLVLEEITQTGINVDYTRRLTTVRAHSAIDRVSEALYTKDYELAGSQGINAIDEYKTYYGSY